MWLLAGAYCDAGRWDHATELLEQCHFALVTKQSEDKVASSEGVSNSGRNIDEIVAELLVWLGVGRSPALPSWRWLPMAMAAEVSLERIASAKDGRQFAYRGLTEVYGVQGTEVIKALNCDAAMTISQEEFHVMGVSLKDKYRNDEGSLHSSATLGRDVDRGFLVLLLLLGRSHAALARQPGVRDYSRTRHLRVATRTFDLILRASVLTPGLEEELYLNQCVVLGELGEISSAVAIARKALSLPHLEESSRLLHVLALLLAALGDDPQSMGAATILCKRASEITPLATSAVRGVPVVPAGDGTDDAEGDDEYSARFVLGNPASQSPNARLSLALLEWHAGDKESSLRSIDQIVSSALMEFRSVTERQHRIRDAVIAAHTGSAASAPSPVKLAAGEDEGLLKEVLTASTLKEYAAACKKPVGLVSSDNPLTVRLLVDILLTCSRFYRTGGKFIKARSCLEDAWRVLFTPASDTLTEVADLLLASTGPAYQRATCAGGACRRIQADRCPEKGPYADGLADVGSKWLGCVNLP
jgi:tetratricopeptide (TPR) repeat protein